MIDLNNVRKVYRTKLIETTALNDVNLHVSKGEFVSIMGPSGCGKSTLLNIIGLLDKPTSGEVNIDGKNMANTSDSYLATFRNEHLGFVFQSFHLIGDLSVRDNVALPLLYRKGGAKDEKTKVREALEAVGLSHRMDHYPAQLSGGQKQRVAIARALIGNPSIILADEPTGNLDSKLGNEIMDLLLDLNTNQEKTIVMVTHDEAMAKKTHRTIRLFDGNLVK